MSILDALPEYKKEEEFPGLHPDVAQGIGLARAWAQANGINLEVTDAVRTPGVVPQGGDPNSPHYGGGAADVAWGGQQWGDANHQALADFLRGAGYHVIDTPHGTGPHIHFERKDRNPVDQFFFPSAEAAPGTSVLDSLPPAKGFVPHATKNILDALPPAKTVSTPQLPEGWTPEMISQAMNNFNLATRPMTDAMNIANQFTVQEPPPVKPTTEPDVNQSVVDIGPGAGGFGRNFIDNAANMGKTFLKDITTNPDLPPEFKIVQTFPANTTETGRTRYQLANGTVVDSQEYDNKIRDIVTTYGQKYDPLVFTAAMMPGVIGQLARPLAGFSVANSLIKEAQKAQDRGETGIFAMEKMLATPIIELYNKATNPAQFYAELQKAPAEVLFNTALELGIVTLAGKGVYDWANKPKETKPLTQEEITATQKQELIQSIRDRLDSIAAQKWDKATWLPQDLMVENAMNRTHKPLSTDLTERTPGTIIDPTQRPAGAIEVPKPSYPESVTAFSPAEVLVENRHPLRGSMPEQLATEIVRVGKKEPINIADSNILDRTGKPISPEGKLLFNEATPSPEIVLPGRNNPGQIVMPNEPARSATPLTSETISTTEYPYRAEKVRVFTEKGIDPTLLPTEVTRGTKPLEVSMDVASSRQSPPNIKNQIRLNDATSVFDKLGERLKTMPLSRAMSDTYDTIRKYTAPGTGDLGNYSQNLLREAFSKEALLRQEITKGVEQARVFFDKVPNRERAVKDFIHAIETGKSTPEIEALIKPLRELQDDVAIRLVQEGFLTEKDLLGNYFSHVGLWERTPENAKIMAQYGTRTPGQSSAPFLKERVFQTAKQGRAAGMKQADVNPIELWTKNVLDQWRFLEVNRVAKEMIDLGAMKRIENKDLVSKAIKQAESALEKYEGVDKAAKVDALAMEILDGLAKKRAKEGYSETIPNDWEAISDRIGKTGWYAPPDVARTFNNTLSQGMYGQHGLYDVLRDTGNNMNSMQLSASFFHGGFTTLDAIVSHFALGLMRVGEGIRTGNVGMAGQGLANIAGTIPAGVTNILTGNKFMKEAQKRGTTARDALEFAGGRITQDAFWKLSIGEKMVQAFRQGDYLGAAWRIPPAILETLPKLIMEELVPRQKLGVFSKMVEYELQKNPNLLSNPELARQVLGKAWDSVENRMGQMAYDNLFWHKYFKDMAMLSTRSVGWNLGTIREIGGGLYDVAKTVKNKGEVESGYRMAYVTALPLVVGSMGAIYQYLATGKPPQELKDYFFPKNGYYDKNGQAQRVSLPSYMKDLYHYYQDPKQTVVNKVHPLFSAIANMIDNKDFYGTEIRHKGDPIVKQAQQAGTYLLGQFLPFTVRNMSQQQDQPTSMKAQNFIGITPAPASVNKSNAEMLASEILTRKMGDTKTQEEFDKSQSKQRIANAIRSNNPNVKSIIAEEMKKGLITPDSIAETYKTKGMPLLMRQFSQLSAPEALDIMKEATPEEKKYLRPIMVQKFSNWAQKASPEEIKRESLKMKEVMK